MTQLWNPDGKDSDTHFMAQDHWLLHNERTYSSIMPVMHVTAADSCVFDFDNYIGGIFDLRYRAIGVGHVTRTVEYERRV